MDFHDSFLEPTFYFNRKCTINKGNKTHIRTRFGRKFNKIDFSLFIIIYFDEWVSFHLERRRSFDQKCIEMRVHSVRQMTGLVLFWMRNIVNWMPFNIIQTPECSLLVPITFSTRLYNWVLIAFSTRLRYPLRTVIFMITTVLLHYQYPGNISSIFFMNF